MAEVRTIATDVMAMVEVMVMLNFMGILVLVVVVKLKDLLAMVKVHALDLLVVQVRHNFILNLVHNSHKIKGLLVRSMARMVILPLIVTIE